MGKLARKGLLELMISIIRVESPQEVEYWCHETSKVFDEELRMKLRLRIPNTSRKDCASISENSTSRRFLLPRTLPSH